VTANFGLVAGEAPPPVVTGSQAQSVWLQSLTYTWDPAIVPANRTLLGYLVRNSTVDGVFTDPPIFVPSFVANGTTPNTSLTLTNLPAVPHFFTVSAITQVSSGTGSLSVSAAGLEPAAASGSADLYAVPRGGQFITVPSTGVLANDTGVNLKAGFASPPGHGSLVFNVDGTFLYQHNGDTATSDSFTYRVGEGTVTDTSPQATVTITIAQEGGQSQVASGTPVSGLEGWTIQNETTEGGPSNWSGVQSPVYSQSGLTGATAATLLKPGTDLIQTDGLPNGRIDYTLTFTIKSDATGAVGIMFRYLNAGNYYRFSMFNGEGGQTAYFRLVKVSMPTGGATTTTVLRETVFPAGQLAYVAGRNYTLTLRADDLPPLLPTDPVQTDLVVILQDPVSGQFLLDDNPGTPAKEWALTDTQSPQTPLATNGLALYSARNPGATYNLLSVTGLDNSTQRSLEVRSSGTGLGTVRGTVADAGAPGGVRDVLLTPGALVTSLAPNTLVTLTATPQVAGSFGGWTLPDLSTTTTPTIQVTLDQAIGLTKVVTAQFTGVPSQALQLDVDANTQASALQDGIILVRHLSGVTGTALTAGAIGANAQRTAPAAIAAFLQSYKPLVVQSASVQSAQVSPEPTAPVTAAFSPQAATLLDAPSALSDQLSAPDTALIADRAALLAEPAALSSQPAALPNHSNLSTQNEALDEGAAIAATQLSSASVRSAPWVAKFLGAEHDDEELVVTFT
jgi:hypothetical protein